MLTEQNKIKQDFLNAPVPARFFSPRVSFFALYLSPSNPALSPRWWSKGWPCQSICQRLTVLQHMHYTDGYHHSRNDCPPHRNQKTRESERVGEDWRNGSWVKITVVCLTETYSERKKESILSQFHLWNCIVFCFQDFHEVLNSEVDFPLCAAEMESPWFSFSTGQRRMCSTLLADTSFNTFCPGLLL